MIIFLLFVLVRIFDVERKSFELFFHVGFSGPRIDGVEMFDFREQVHGIHFGGSTQYSLQQRIVYERVLRLKVFQGSGYNCGTIY